LESIGQSVLSFQLSVFSCQFSVELIC
jgi:hypothetical protein